MKLLTLKEGEKLQDISIVIPDGEDSDSSAAASDEDAPIIEEAGDETSEE